jgi:hypothetical protein
MGVAETDYGRVGVIVAGTPVPALRSVVRTELNSPKGHRGPRINVPVLGSAHEGVYIPKGRVGPLAKDRCTGKRYKREKENSANYIHGFERFLERIRDL